MQNTDTAIIEPDALARLLAEDPAAVKLVDATYLMPGSAVSGEELFARHHIKGAVYFDIDAIADQANALPHMLPAQGEFEDAVSRLGIGNNDLVIAYDQSGIAMAAARVWWMFRVFGHDRVRVLNGGLPLWRASGYPVESGPAESTQPATFKAAFRPHLVSDLAAVRTASEDSNTLILDARSEERFSGLMAEPRAGLRAGHIPGSRNLPFFELIDPADGRLKAPAMLERSFAALPDKPHIIASCGSGVTACVLALACHLLGKDDVAVYDGSWVEWGQTDAGTPVASGLQTGT